MKAGFIPISLEKYINLHLKNNSGTTRKEITVLVFIGGICYNP